MGGISLGLVQFDYGGKNLVVVWVVVSLVELDDGGLSLVVVGAGVSFV